MTVGNLKVIILISILRNYSQVKKILINRILLLDLDIKKGMKGFKLHSLIKKNLSSFSSVRMPEK